MCKWYPTENRWAQHMIFSSFDQKDEVGGWSECQCRVLHFFAVLSTVLQDYSRPAALRVITNATGEEP